MNLEKILTQLEAARDACFTENGDNIDTILVNKIMDAIDLAMSLEEVKDV